MAQKNFPLSKRLTNSQDFDRVFKNNTARISTAEFLILAKKNRLNCARLGMVVSKKITRNAVARNRIKRLIRENFRIFELPPVDIIILTRKKINDLNNSQLRISLNQSFETIAKKLVAKL